MADGREQPQLVAMAGRSYVSGMTVTRRPSQRDEPVAADDPSAPLRVLVDAELGILLRIAEPGDGGEPEVTELVAADFDPVIDPDRFAPPPGSRIAEGLGEALGGTLGPAWWAAKTAAGLAAGALGAWIRYSPFRRVQPAAAEESRPSPT